MNLKWDEEEGKETTNEFLSNKYKKSTKLKEVKK